MDRMKKTNLPPGFRFHPTDEELIIHYLRNQAMSRPNPVSIIQELDIYKFDPWELPEKAEFGENEWYFFSPRNRKYPNGVRPNRATPLGYWKATGTDKAIHSGSNNVGVKKSLVFYRGKPPKGVKTDWIMHEYRLSDSRRLPTKLNGSMRLDDCVLCRIYKKKHLVRSIEKKEDLRVEWSALDCKAEDSDDKEKTLKFPRTLSVAHLLEIEYLSLSQLLSENLFNLETAECQATKTSSSNDSNQHHDMAKLQSTEMIKTNQFGSSLMFQVNQNVLLNQHITANPLLEFVID
ncbi:hypothetical protein Sjap_015627 [Stephania japonica]|uniref:NAC domain-containing protein n=1 Tax=Stephania japonica TaxID=461633 RepID=A0AAP0NT05_9MAGN